MRSIQLTPEEQGKPYAKYFTRPPAPADPKRLEAMARPMDPAKALRAEDMNRLLDPGYHEVESGWCILPDGTGYIANLTPMPGVSLEMVNWWFAWHALEDLRYKIWWPEGHFSTCIPDPVERARAADTTLPLVQRFQGLTHHVQEDVGCGPEDIRIAFLSPKDFGFDMSRFDSTKCTLVAANGKSRPVGAFFLRPWAPAMMCHFVRETVEGVEFRTRFWMGRQVVDGKPKTKLPPFVKVPAAAAQGLATHNIHEYTNLGSFLPQIHAEMKDLR
nr:hydrolase [uncultured Holophaga sp.]